MTMGEFLSDRIDRIVLEGIVAAVASVFLMATGTQQGVVMILLFTLFIIFVIVQAVDFLKCRFRLEELEAILDGLDHKYLFTECAPIPGNVYEQHLWDIMRRAGRDMIGTVSEAQAAQREYREYVESWVHEIKAPITASGLICQKAEPELRRKLMRELSQIEAHVERTLFYARAESPEKDFIVRKADLSQIVTQAINNHRSLLIQSKIRLETEGLTQTVYTDEKWAVFILGQLLQNAARYRDEEPVICLTARTLGQLVQLRVSDNGIGIADHELPRVFERGFTGSNGRLRGGSTGMGLYLCRKLADCLEIAIAIESQPGEGTTVILTFPAGG